MTDELDEQRAAEIRLERAVADTLSADGWAENWEHAVTCARAVIPVAQAPVLARIAELEEALFQWLSYDQLLRQYSGPMERLGAGDFELADKTYDGCVQMTTAALRSTQ